MEQEARDFIVNELGKHRHRRDVIADVCVRYNLNWKQAEELVAKVEIYDGQRVARRQSPLLIILGAGVILAGLALTIDAIIYFWTLPQLDSIEQLANAQLAYYMAASLVLGVAMITGGIIGLRKVLADAL